MSKNLSPTNGCFKSGKSSLSQSKKQLIYPPTLPSLGLGRAAPGSTCADFDTCCETVAKTSFPEAFDIAIRHISLTQKDCRCSFRCLASPRWSSALGAASAPCAPCAKGCEIVAASASKNFLSIGFRAFRPPPKTLPAASTLCAALQSRAGSQPLLQLQGNPSYLLGGL